MIINATVLLPHLKEKVRPMQSDTSRHLLCPYCGIRTKLNTLGDGRRKCTVCGKKFRVHKATEETKLLQCAEILLCFCLDFSAHRAAQITHHRYRLVATYYDHFRKLLTEKTLPKEKIPLLAAKHIPHSSRCQWCNSITRSGDKDGKAPAFGVQLRDSGEVTIEPLKDEEAVFHFHMYGVTDVKRDRREGYAGLICCGKFHRFSSENKKNDGAQQVWTWIRERARSHHGIWKKNTGFYLKELEWKYNNKALDPDVQAKKIVDLMPKDFLTSWSLTAGAPSQVQRRATAA